MKFAIVQITSVLDPEVNLNKINSLISDATAKGAKAIFLPEVFYSMNDGTGPSPYLVEEGNEHYKKIVSLAKSHGVYLLGGSVAYKSGDKVLNRTYNIDPKGNIIGVYDKNNLFSVSLESKKQKLVLDEASVYTAGSELNITKFEEWTLGTSICFDLRFPQVFQEYFKAGCNILSVSSAFTVPTGKAHWHTLLKARAIETQSYVVASNQYGVHNEKISTYGHSLVVDPWGEIICDLGEGEKYEIFEPDLSYVQQVRNRIPLLK